MQLNLKSIIHTAGASLPFDFQLDLSALDFFGLKPFTQPVQICGLVKNRAGALELKGEAITELDLVCDRCLKAFSSHWTLPVDAVLAESLEDEENNEIILLEKGCVDLEELFTTALVLEMDVKHLCDEDCQGLCDRCGANLNDGSCSCTSEMDPRLAALAQLLDREEQS